MASESEAQRKKLKQRKDPRLQKQSNPAKAEKSTEDYLNILEDHRQRTLELIDLVRQQVTRKTADEKPKSKRFESRSNSNPECLRDIKLLLKLTESANKKARKQCMKKENTSEGKEVTRHKKKQKSERKKKQEKAAETDDDDDVHKVRRRRPKRKTTVPANKTTAIAKRKLKLTKLLNGSAMKMHVEVLTDKCKNLVVTKLDKLLESEVESDVEKDHKTVTKHAAIEHTKPTETHRKKQSKRRNLEAPSITTESARIISAQLPSKQKPRENSILSGNVSDGEESELQESSRTRRTKALTSKQTLPDMTVCRKPTTKALTSKQTLPDTTVCRTNASVVSHDRSSSRLRIDLHRRGEEPEIKRSIPHSHHRSSKSNTIDKFLAEPSRPKKGAWQKLWNEGLTFTLDRQALQSRILDMPGFNSVLHKYIRHVETISRPSVGHVETKSRPSVASLSPELKHKENLVRLAGGTYKVVRSVGKQLEKTANKRNRNRVKRLMRTAVGTDKRVQIAHNELLKQRSQLILMQLNRYNGCWV